MPYMTVAENVWIRREPMKGLGFMDFVDHAEMRRMTEHLFRRLNIDIDPDIEVRYLTVANRQIVEIAKAVSFESDILIMDEPTSALTEREVEHLFAIIADLKAHGVGIVYITHKMDEVFEIADDVSVFIGQHQRVVPGQRVGFVVEPRTVVAGAEHRLVIRPLKAHVHVVGARPVGQRDLVVVAEPEARPPRNSPECFVVVKPPVRSMWVVGVALTRNVPILRLSRRSNCGEIER